MLVVSDAPDGVGIPPLRFGPGILDALPFGAPERLPLQLNGNLRVSNGEK